MVGLAGRVGSQVASGLPLFLVDSGLCRRAWRGTVLTQLSLPGLSGHSDSCSVPCAPAGASLSRARTVPGEGHAGLLAVLGPQESGQHPKLRASWTKGPCAAEWLFILESELTRGREAGRGPGAGLPRVNMTQAGHTVAGLDSRPLHFLPLDTQRHGASCQDGDMGNQEAVLGAASRSPSLSSEALCTESPGLPPRLRVTLPSQCTGGEDR